MLTFTKSELQQKIEKISRNMEKIKSEISENTSPIFVELLGTPKSGKTTLLKSLKNLFANNGIQIFTRRETAEYNPVAKDSKQYDLWMVLELFKNLLDDISNKQGQIVIYDRGILDRLTWLENAVEKGTMTSQDIERIKGLYSLESVKNGYKPISLGFITSPELSIQRKGSIGRFVNPQTLTAYNRTLLEKQGEISALSSSYSLTKTDDYQGRIENFILDLSSDLTDQISKQLEEKKEEKSKGQAVKAISDSDGKDER